MNGAVFKRNFPFYLFAFLLLGAFAFLFFQGKAQKYTRKKDPQTKTIADSGRDQRLQKFTLTGFDNTGQKFWNLQGETAKIDPGQTIYLDENVTLRLKDNTVIRTDRVQWSQDGGTMRTDAPVFVDHEAVKVKGIGAVGRPSDSFIQLNRKIEMTANDGSVLTCEGPMKIYYNENKMVLYRNVKAVDKRGTLLAKRMDVFFEDEKKEVKQIIATGDVSILRGSDTTHSKRAIYTVATGSIRLEGDPDITVHEGSDALTTFGVQK